jgi:hypothetical protein
MYERFTDRARKVMQLAHQEAQRFNHEYMGADHILLGLVKEGSGVAANVLKNLDIDLRKIRLEVEKIVRPGPDMVTMGKLPQTPRARKVIEYAIEEARNLHHNYVGTEHLLLGLLREEEGVASQVLMNLGLKLANVRKEVLQLLGHEVASEESCSGRVLVRRWSRGSRKPDGTPEKESSSPPPEETPPSAMHERIRSLDRQLRLMRFLLGGLIGALVGALLNGGTGAFRGWVVGAVVVLLGEIPAGLAGGISGVVLAAAYLPSVIEWVLAGFLGAVTGMILSEIGKSPGRRGFLGIWQKR